MSQPVPSIDIRAFTKRHLMDVFELMLSKKAVPLDQADAPRPLARICGSVGFAGSKVTGAVYLHLSASFALQAATAMLNLAPERIAGEAEVNDAVGEMTNMLAGGLKSVLCDSGRSCAVSTPAIIRGTSFAIEPVPEVERTCVVFDCENERLMAEIHIKYT